MEARITKIEECIGGISICVQYHEPRNHIASFDVVGVGNQRKSYTEELEDFDANIKKLHIGDMIELKEENKEK